MILDIDHVGIAVSDLDAAVERYRRTLGVEPTHRERVVDQGVEEVLFAVGTSFIQLSGSLGPDTPVGSFLAKRGPRAYITSPTASMTWRRRSTGLRDEGIDRSTKSRDAARATR